MGAGHLAVGLALKRADARVNVGFWIFAAFRMAGAGQGRGAGFQEYPQRHFLTFTFPYSHGLAATALWATAAGGIAVLAAKRR